MSEHNRIPSVVGKRRKAREFALLGIYESIINPAADFAAIDANLVSVIINCMHINQKSAEVVRNCVLFLDFISSDGNLEGGMD